MTITKKLLEKLSVLQSTAVKAGDAINQIRGTLEDVDEKADGSPVTRADRASHDVIVPVLEKLEWPYPVISEEGDLSTAAHCPESFWLVDPLDGTKEFIKGLDDFTVNIALVVEKMPALGIVYLPATGVMYYAVKGEGAWRQKAGEKEPRRIQATGNLEKPLTAVVSRSHASPETEAFLKKLGVQNTIARGSSLKMCAVAEGSADIYPRLNPTWYWDTAAGASVALEAGCHLTDPKGNPLDYDLSRAMKHYGFVLSSRPFSGL
ncbi:MAG: 3'(2'),5'-bisphosphate nucleotidase CysQ [Lentisphaeria bacterium]